MDTFRRLVAVGTCAGLPRPRLVVDFSGIEPSFHRNSGPGRKKTCE